MKKQKVVLTKDVLNLIKELGRQIKELQKNTLSDASASPKKSPRLIKAIKAVSKVKKGAKLIEELGLRDKLRNLLIKNDIKTIDDLMLHSEKSLKEIKFMGQTFVNEIKAALPRGVKLRTDDAK